MAMPRSFGSSQVTFRSPIQIWPDGHVEQARDGVEQGRLAAAGRAEQDDELALLDIEVETVEDADGLEGDG